MHLDNHFESQNLQIEVKLQREQRIENASAALTVVGTVANLISTLSPPLENNGDYDHLAAEEERLQKLRKKRRRGIRM